ncbi:MAG TPA: hypothetical protein VKE88_00595 [Candidatus Nanoarchaeia archaeon]|nr:hypothetical protein [Candidatus Nanoarchaeia archaeon]
MVEFNPDGSIKLPSRMLKQAEENNTVFESRPSFRILRNQTSTITPLTCELTIETSKHLDPSVVERVFNQTKENFRTDAGLSITQFEGKHIVKIVSGFNRCNWCHAFLNNLSDTANARIIRTDRCDDKTKNRNNWP